MRRTLPLAALAAALLAGAPAAFAEDIVGTCKRAPGLSYSIRPGLDGRMRDGCWAPVEVRFSNQGADVAGQLELVHRLWDGSTGRETVAVDLPGRSNKSYTIYFVPDVNQGTELGLVSESGRVLFDHELDYELLPSVGLHIVLALGPSAYGLFPDSRTSDTEVKGPHYLTLQVPFDQAPDRWIGWDMADQVLLADPAPGSFPSRRHVAEFLRWVRAGGRLLFCAGDRWPSAIGSPLEALFPGTPTESREAELAPLLRGEAPPGRAVLTALRAPRGRVLAGTPEFPVAIEHRVGSGLVRFFAFDPGRAPFVSWPGMERFWRAHALRLPPPASDINSGNWYYGTSIASRIESAPVGQRIGTGWLLFTLGAYFLVLGLVDYYLLRRLRRLDWMWASMAFWVSLFTAICWGLSEWGRERAAVERSLTVVDAHPDGFRSGRSFVCLYAPVASTFRCTGQAGSLVLRHYRPVQTYERTRGGGLLGDIRGRLVQGEGMELRDLRVYRGMMVSLVTRWAEDGGVDGSTGPPLRAARTGDRVAIFNASAVQIRAVLVLSRKGIWEAGTIDPDMEKSVDLSVDPAWKLDPLQANASVPGERFSDWAIEAARAVAHQTALRLGLQESQRAARGDELDAHDPLVSDLSDLLEDEGTLVVLGATAVAEAPLTIDGGERKREALTVYRVLVGR